MKKLLLSLVLLSTMVLGMNAQSQSTSSGCYRGFVDAGYTIGVGDYEFGRFEVNTSHGYQINPYFFVGAGLGFHFMPSYETPDMDIPLDTRESNVDIPVFANARVNFSKSKVSPFIDVKGGTYVNNNGGLYLNGSAGVRIACRGKQAVNILIGYTNEKLEFETFWKFNNSHSMSYTRKPTSYEAEGVTLKVGYEF